MLANERTLLAYIRTALALLLAGATIFHFLRGPAAAGSGLALTTLGCLCLAIGAIRFRNTARQLAARPGR